ncbi:hypothetical protein VCR29J2_320004 [Vibrio coralliirubri]|nr:hypothetical protein VCR29J2_320004 [Vibrio coralliirubri]
MPWLKQKQGLEFLGFIEENLPSNYSDPRYSLNMSQGEGDVCKIM